MPDFEKVIIIGAGQAGLCVSFFLTKAQIPHVIFEKGSIANAWKKRWDSFCLVTPNWTINLPGKPYTGIDKDGFMSRDDFIQYLELWAESFKAPVKENIEVIKISGKTGSFRVDTNIGSVEASIVIVATATYQEPKIPEFAKLISKDILSLHADTYKSPNEISDGAVLVVGSGQTGCQIVEDLIRANRKVYFSVSNNGRLPRRYRGKDCIEWQNEMKLLDRTPDMLDDPKDRFKGDPHVSGRDGGKTLSLHEFREKGVELLGKIKNVEEYSVVVEESVKKSLDFSDRYASDFFVKVDDHISLNKLDLPLANLDEIYGFGKPTDDPPIEKRKISLKDENINTIIFATGFSYDFTWIDFPVFDEMGYPQTDYGKSKVEGIYFCGLNWMVKRKSGIIWGVGEDAERVANAVVENFNNAYV